MSLTWLLTLAFLFGGICGLRSMTGPAIVCWAAHLGWLHLNGTPLGFLHSPISLVVFSLLALGELVADKLPFIPNRTKIGPLIVRFMFGALCGAALLISGGVGAWPGVVAGGVGGVAGGFLGYHVRRWLVVHRKLPDFPIALLEDLIAIAGGLWMSSQL